LWSVRLVPDQRCAIYWYNAMSQWREIVDSLPDAIIVLDPELNPSIFNPSAEALLSAAPITHALFQQLLAQNSWLQDMVTSCLNTGQSLDNPEAVLLIERRQIAVRVQVSPLLGRRGDVKGVITQLCDLSYHRKLERVSAPDERVFQLSPAGLAHELRNPLTGMKGAAELLVALSPENQRARQYCDIILLGVNRIASLVEQALSASGPPLLKLEPVNIHQPLQQALKMAGLFEPPVGITVEQVFDPSLPPVNGDSAALERVFLNLFRNSLEAILATPEAQGRIRVRTAIETQFRLASNGKRRQALRVEISDTGIGLTEEQMGQVFAPFFSTKAGGNGLGLVLSQRTVALHGGRLWARRGLSSSETDNESAQANTRLRGMTFYVLLPLHTE
jgi:two-component system nitrogen regulation sensor histidine kinase GlnL